jgi:hypothetical protein
MGRARRDAGLLTRTAMPQVRLVVKITQCNTPRRMKETLSGSRYDGCMSKMGMLVFVRA